MPSDIAPKEWKNVEEEKEWSPEQYQAERVWQSLRREIQMDLSELTDAQLREKIDELISGTPAERFGEVGRDLLAEEARKEFGTAEEEGIEEIEELTDEQLAQMSEQERNEALAKRKEMRTIEGRRPKNGSEEYNSVDIIRGEGVAKTEFIQVPAVKVPKGALERVSVPAVETPGQRAANVVSEIERGVEQRIADTDAGVRQVAGQPQVAVPVTFGDRVKNVVTKVRDTIVNVSRGIIDRIRRLGGR